MKVLVFNVRYSPNLGDGLLALCLENALRRAMPGVTVETIDLAGREDYPANEGHRGLALAALGGMPAPFRRLAVRHGLSARLGLLRSLWQTRLKTADAVVIGGGNLFQDDDLNFPLKIGALLDCVREADKPVGIYAVGVGSAWSAPGRALFGKLAHCRVFHASVRDAASAANWRHHFGASPANGVVPDPGLLAGDLGGGGFVLPSHEHRHVGICVTHPVVLRRHAGQPGRTLPLATKETYRQLVTGLADVAGGVTLFCNGAYEDQTFLERIARELPRNLLEIAPRPRSPEALVRLIAGFDVVVAHRLHACIASIALGVTPIGLDWDPKVGQFFAGIGLNRLFVSAACATPAVICSHVETALSSRLDDHDRARPVIEARRGVVGLARDLATAMASGRGDDRGPAGLEHLPLAHQKDEAPRPLV